MMQSTKKRSVSFAYPDPKKCPYTKALSIEEQILNFSGLSPYDDLKVFDVSIDFLGENKIHTYLYENKSQKTLVLLHGYGGSSVLFYSVLKDLTREFSVYCVDLLGMGLSSRPEFTCEGGEESITYFVESLDKWREAVGLKEFYLTGHSFGAYVAANYALRYQDYVKKLILVSPIGITSGQDSYAFIEWVDSMGWIKKKLYKMYIKLWEDKVTPMEFLKKHPIIGKFVLRKYLQRQNEKKDKHPEVSRLLYDLIFTFLEMPAGSEKALHNLFGPPMAIPYLPVEDYMLTEITIPTKFFYGEKDWVDWVGAHRLSQSEAKTNFKFKWIKDSGHQIFLTNPNEIAKEIIQFVNE